MKPDPLNILRKAFSLNNPPYSPDKGQESLERILDSAYVTDYYKELFDGLGLSPKQIAEDIAQIPLTDRDTVRKDTSRFMATGHKTPLRKFITSGSSGTPGETYVDQEALDHRAAIGIISLREMGRKPTDLFAEVARTHSSLFPLLPAMGLFRKLFISVFSKEEDIFNAIRDKKPDVLGWYPSMSHSMACLNDTEGNPVRLKKVFSSGEVLSKEMRKRIGDSFSCPVVQQYASVEFSAMAWDCAEHNLHVHSPSFHVEIVDDKGRPKKGGSGEIAVTCLFNHAMPLIRYRLGDRARWGHCSCGKEGPVLESIEGRSDDMISLPSGRVRNPFGFNLLYYGEQITGVWRYQIIQEREDLLVFRFVPEGQGLSDAAKADLLKRLDLACLGEDVKVEFEAVDEIPRNPSGKFQKIISKVRRGQ